MVITYTYTLCIVNKYLFSVKYNKHSKHIPILSLTHQTITPKYTHTLSHTHTHFHTHIHTHTHTHAHTCSHIFIDTYTRIYKRIPTRGVYMKHGYR